MKIKIDRIWFEKDSIFGEDTNGNVWKQSLLWYPKLKEATDDDRNRYKFKRDGIVWDNIDEIIKYESFGYDDAEPSALQKFFLSHKEINIAEFAKRTDVSPTLLRHYIRGAKKPSRERELHILNAIHDLAKEYAKATF